MTVAYRETAVQMEDLNETITMLLSQTAEELARETRFVQRRSPLNGLLFARTLILGWLANPEASYGQLRELLAIQGCDISEQALEQRLSERSADFLLSLLHAFVGECIGSEPVMIELLRRFEGVYVQDGSVITLPAALEGLYKGCGDGQKKADAVACGCKCGSI